MGRTREEISQDRSTIGLPEVTHHRNRARAVALAQLELLVDADGPGSDIG